MRTILDEKIENWKDSGVSRNLFEYCENHKRLAESAITDPGLRKDDDAAIIRNYMFNLGRLQVLNAILNCNFISEDKLSETESV